MKHRLTYTAPACEAVKLETEHTLMEISSRRVVLNFAAFETLSEGSTTESLTW